MWFCVYEVQKQAKLISGDKNQDGVYMCERVWGAVINWKRVQRNLLKG